MAHFCLFNLFISDISETIKYYVFTGNITVHMVENTLNYNIKKLEKELIQRINKPIKDHIFPENYEKRRPITLRDLQSIMTKISNEEILNLPYYSRESTETTDKGVSLDFLNWCFVNSFNSIFSLYIEIEDIKSEKINKLFGESLRFWNLDENGYIRDLTDNTDIVVSSYYQSLEHYPLVQENIIYSVWDFTNISKTSYVNWKNSIKKSYQNKKGCIIC